MPLSIKYLLSLLAVGITLYAFIPYIRNIVSGSTKPHVFSWIIWGITTFIVFLAQLEAEGGIGAWPIGISGTMTVGIALLAIKYRGDVSIHKLDWLFFIAALSALPVWYLSSEPLWAVVILTTVDLLGFGPTIRKAYDHPHEESVGFFALFTIRNIATTLALESYSLTTVLFPLAIALACVLLIGIILVRRKRLNKST